MKFADTMSDCFDNMSLDRCGEICRIACTQTGTFSCCADLKASYVEWYKDRYYTFILIGIGSVLGVVLLIKLVLILKERFSQCHDKCSKKRAANIAQVNANLDTAKSPLLQTTSQL